MTQVWIEVRSTVKRSGRPRLVPIEDATRHTGFRSVFGYPEETAEIIRIQGGTQGLRGLPVYADTIFMDFDDHDPVEFRELLRREGIAHQEYDSGGRSRHFHLPISEPVCGAWVPTAIKQWTMRHAPTADVSFLHPAGMYRLAGTFHHKYPGRCKALLYEQGGSLIKIEEPVNAPQLSITTRDEVTEEMLFAELTNRKGPGGRSVQIWKIATIAFQLGYEHEKVSEFLSFWNQTAANPPQDQDVLDRQMTSAYERLRKICHQNQK